LKFVGRTNLIKNFWVKLYNEVINKTVSTRLDSWAWIQIANIQSFCYLTLKHICMCVHFLCVDRIQKVATSVYQAIVLVFQNCAFN
jgi:hypothetical protein